MVTLLGQGRGGGGLWVLRVTGGPVAGTLEEINASVRVGDLDRRRSTSRHLTKQTGPHQDPEMEVTLTPLEPVWC